MSVRVVLHNSVVSHSSGCTFNRNTPYLHSSQPTTSWSCGSSTLLNGKDNRVGHLYANDEIQCWNSLPFPSVIDSAVGGLSMQNIVTKDINHLYDNMKRKIYYWACFSVKNICIVCLWSWWYLSWTMIPTTSNTYSASHPPQACWTVVLQVISSGSCQNIQQVLLSVNLAQTGLLPKTYRTRKYHFP